MTDMIPITNDNEYPIRRGGRTILAGATAYFDPSELPRQYHPQAATLEPVAPANPLEEILSTSIKNIEPILPTLSDDQLNEIQTLEQAGDNRQGLEKLFVEERLRRADLKTNGQNSTDIADLLHTSLDTIQTEVKTLSDELLADLLAAEQDGFNREDILTVIETELEARK